MYVYPHHFILFWWKQGRKENLVLSFIFSSNVNIFINVHMLRKMYVVKSEVEMERL